MLDTEFSLSNAIFWQKIKDSVEFLVIPVLRDSRVHSEVSILCKKKLVLLRSDQVLCNLFHPLSVK